MCRTLCCVRLTCCAHCVASIAADIAPSAREYECFAAVHALVQETGASDREWMPHYISYNAGLRLFRLVPNALRIDDSDAADPYRMCLRLFRDSGVLLPLDLKVDARQLFVCIDVPQSLRTCGYAGTVVERSDKKRTRRQARQRDGRRRKRQAQLTDANASDSDGVEPDPFMSDTDDSGCAP